MSKDRLLRSDIVKQRNSNLELYRIIVMFSIVAHHYVVNSGLLKVISYDYFSVPSLFYWLFGMWGKTGINCFVLITGYFMVTSQITLRKFLKLILELEFYNVLIGSIFFFSGYHDYTVNDFFLQMIPVKLVGDCFVSCFILFWLTIPFLNILIKNMNCRQHQRLIWLCLFIYTGMLYVPYSIVTMNYVSWFIVLYFISSYIRLYPDTIYRSQSMKTWGGLTVLSIGAAIGSVILTCWWNDAFHRTHVVYWLVSDSNAILAILVGVTSFMFFKNIRMSYSKIINNIAATTFGILLIHANSNAMRQWLWHDIVDCVGHYSIPYYFLFAFLAVVSIFTVCSIIDYIRINTFEKYTFKLIDYMRGVKSQY